MPVNYKLVSAILVIFLFLPFTGILNFDVVMTGLGTVQRTRDDALRSREGYLTTAMEQLPHGLQQGLISSRIKKFTNRHKPKIESQITELISNQRLSEQTFSKKRSVFLWPVAGIDPVITSTFYEDREGKKHRALDIAVPIGTPIIASYNGVVFKGDQGDGGLGKYVYIVHNNGLTTYYGHLSDWAPIKDGTAVNTGTLIGWSGNTGRSTGPHLHFAIKSAQSFVDPALLLVDLQSNSTMKGKSW
ncbi:peptidase M23 [Thermincola ferriacetica]|uniref:Peptidase M23 n=1 Tax=Thermincola ferriacetica TaxID=281456 RepID=A0A0L6W5A0_9FIRM|nr:M23 family metallopeptidase [Thermincola ferriacetica]KNZ70538.1 peptidase M23 [Thermincola ferriacetica]